MSCIRSSGTGSMENESSGITRRGQNEDSIKFGHLRIRYRARDDKLLDTASLL